MPVFAGNDVLDIVGTGGDGIGSVNISTGNDHFAATHGKMPFRIRAQRPP